MNLNGSSIPINNDRQLDRHGFSELRQIAEMGRLDEESPMAVQEAQNLRSVVVEMHVDHVLDDDFRFPRKHELLHCDWISSDVEVGQETIPLEAFAISRFGFDGMPRENADRMAAHPQSFGNFQEDFRAIMPTAVEIE